MAQNISPLIAMYPNIALYPTNNNVLVSMQVMVQV